MRDSSGGAVPDAIVSLYRPAMTDPANQTKTTAAGIFEFDALPPESYRVTIEKPGFAVYEARDVRVSPGAETPLNGIVLALGAQPTIVSTSEKLPGVQSNNAEVSTTLTTEQLEQLPILNRDPLQLVRTQAGVVIASGTYTAIDALRTSYSNVTLDGINIQDNTVRYNGLDIVNNNLKIGQVSQFTLITSNQGAIYGNGATQTAFASPSGTNQLHGSVFYLNSNNLMNANSFFGNRSGQKSAYKSNQGGFTAGGPLIHNKLFGYTEFEMYRQRNSIGRAVYTFDTSTLSSFGVAINPTVASILALIPKPNVPGADSNTRNYQYQSRGDVDTDNVIARLDYIPSSKHTITASYLWNRLNVDRAFSLYNPNAAVVQHERATLFSASWRYNIAARLTNEVRFGADIAPISFINGNRTLPYNVDLGPVLNFGFYDPISGYNDQGRRLHTYDIQDNASYVFGRHTLQFGFQSQLIRISLYLNNGSIPTVVLGNSSAKTLRQFEQAVLAGNVDSYQQTFYASNRSGAFGGLPNFVSPTLDNYAPYVQDTWKMMRGLTLTMGLRYDYYTPVSDAKGLTYIPTLINGSISQTINASNVTFTEQGHGLYRADKNNFAPNIGIAFDPFGNGRTAVRAGYAINYVNDDVITGIGQMVLQNASNLSVLEMPLSGTTLPNVPRFAAPVSGTSIRATTGVNGFPVSLVNPGLRTPYVEQWNFGIQQELGGFIFDLRYVGNHAVKMLRATQLQPGNRGYYANLGTPEGSDFAVFNAGYYAPTDVASTGYYFSNASSSTYNALQFDVSRRLRPNLQLQANYTFAKALTDTGQFTSQNIDNYRDPGNLRLDRGPSPWDIRHAFKANLIYDLPIGRRFTAEPLRSVLGGWSVSSIVLVQSGTPFSIMYGDPNGNLGIIDTATALVGGSTLDKVIDFHMTPTGPSIIADRATNLDKNDPLYSSGVRADGSLFPGQAFAVPIGGPGQLAPRMFHGPASFDWDLGIQRKFKITEHQTLELRGVAVNVLNHPSFGFGNQVINFSGFGQNAFTLYQPRAVQLSVYYRF